MPIPAGPSHPAKPPVPAGRGMCYSATSNRTARRPALPAPWCPSAISTDAGLSPHRLHRSLSTARPKVRPGMVASRSLTRSWTNTRHVGHPMLKCQPGKSASAAARVGVSVMVGPYLTRWRRARRLWHRGDAGKRGRLYRWDIRSGAGVGKMASALFASRRNASVSP